jgi:hypothetical protein
MEQSDTQSPFQRQDLPADCTLGKRQFPRRSGD